MLAQYRTMSLFGLQAEEVTVEVDVHRGKVVFYIVGLPDAAVAEARERVRSAIKNSGFIFPNQRIAINLAPANLRKQGAHFDLPMALGILRATEQIPEIDESSSFFCGELGFDGSLRPISGVLPLVAAAKKQGFREIFVPAANQHEAALIEGISVYGVANLAEVAAHLQNKKPLACTPVNKELNLSDPPPANIDFSHIQGQESAKRALEIAAAGGHNVLMVGPPGSGKTMLAQAFASILPPLTVSESLEITQLYSIAGLITQDQPVITTRPCRAVHHTASGIAIVGGGNPPRPGEISLAHRGVLFLDEFAEFPTKTLEVLRQPLEDGFINVSRASGSSRFPARLTLLAAMNPCPCGFLGDPEKDCRCGGFELERYRRKLSGPILDRIDLHFTVPRVSFAKLNQTTSENEDSCTIRERVVAARNRQRQRLASTGRHHNAEMSSPEVKQWVNLTDEAAQLIKQAVTQKSLSGRAYYRLLKVARTIADLADCDEVESHHIAEAIGYRQTLFDEK